MQKYLKLVLLGAGMLCGVALETVAGGKFKDEVKNCLPSKKESK